MATEHAPTTNGYGGQYGQPAELSGSAPAASSHNSSASQSTTATSGQKADPQEIGWYFVEQYYTTLSKSPDKIQLFYSKKSQLITGNEAEKVVPVVGSKAVGEKIKSLEIQDCKVRVLNVDSQSSDRGIVIQVIGEMSNKSEPHRKFVQTFVLAEQPNGYYVLNDIFRYLNLDEDEIIDDEPSLEPAPTVQPTSTNADTLEQHEDEVVDNEPAADIVDAKLEEHKEEPEAMADEAEEPVANDEEVVQEAPKVEDALDETEELKEEEPIAEAQVEQEVEPTETAPTAEPVKPVATPSQPEAPPAKKTWASLVGNKAPAVPALPQSAPAAPSQPKATRPTQVSQPSKTASETVDTPSTTSNDATAPQGDEWQAVGDGKKGSRPQGKASEGQTLAYIKNVTDNIDARKLRNTLERYGSLKYFDVSRAKNCAFVEFESTAGYLAAVAANPHSVGEDGEQINVEERRPRPNAYGGANAPYGSRGGSTTGRGRGGSMQGQGRTGSQNGNYSKDAGRGGFQRGGKSGNVTPRGRGQAQAT